MVDTRDAFGNRAHSSNRIFGGLLRDLVEICEVPAPPFAEAERAQKIAERAEELRFNPRFDREGNVIFRIPSEPKKEGPVTMCVAHMDTVFPAGTEIRVREEGERLYAPGIADNTAGIAVLLGTADLLQSSSLPRRGELLIAFSVGEEGRGDLRGMRHLMDMFGAEVDRVIGIDGELGSIIHQAVGCRRLRIEARTEGGHSWGDFGVPSAIHVLTRTACAIQSMEVPRRPKTTYNIGTIEGGMAINVIAPRASMELDLRSIEASELHRMKRRVAGILEEERGREGVEVQTTVIGDRPTGGIDANHPLVNLIRDVHRDLGIESRSNAASTDANIPLSIGIPAVTVGVSRRGNIHSPNEYLYRDSLLVGCRQLYRILKLLHGSPVGDPPP